MQRATHINNSKLKHKAYEDIDTMSSIQQKKDARSSGRT